MSSIESVDVGNAVNLMILGDGIFLCIFVGVSNWGFVNWKFTDMNHEVICVFEIVHCEQEVCEVDTEG